jgi:hypothetical protein
MNEKDFKVEKMDFNDLEWFLNNYHNKFPNYYIYQILPEHCYDGAFAVVILERMKDGE